MINQIFTLTKILISYPSTSSNSQALKTVLEEAIKPLKQKKA